MSAAATPLPGAEPAPAPAPATASRRSWLRWSPDGRLLAAVGLWVLAATAAVVFPSLVSGVLFAGGMLAGVLVVDAVLLLRTPYLVLRRVLPERLEVGSAGEIAIEVSNPGRRRVLADLYEELPRDLADRDPEFHSVDLGPGETRQLHYPVQPRERGDRGFGPLASLARSPLGLWRRRVLAGEDDTVRVLPDTHRLLSSVALHPRRVLASLGVKVSRQRGEGTEFESLRDYVLGDDPRHIDWRATARRGRLVTRLLQHERNHTVVIAVDASRLMGSRLSPHRTKLDAAVDAAIALAWSALHAGDRTGLLVFDRSRRLFVEPLAHRASLGVFVESLAPIQSELVEADYRVLSSALLGRRQKRSLVVVLTDFADSDPDALVTPMALLARRHRVLLVALRDRRFDVLDPRRAGAGADEGGGETDAVYRDIVLDDLLREREETLARLRLQGVHTLDLVSEEVTASVLNRYLAMRYEGI